MEYLPEFLYNVLTGVSVAVLLWYLIILPILSIGYKQWDRKMENPPPPPKRKSFKERLAKKQKFLYALKLPYPEFQKVVDYMDYAQYQKERLLHGIDNVIIGDKPDPRHFYQPINKVDTSNPPKETGT